MTQAECLAMAAEAERKAHALFEKVAVAREALPLDDLGYRPHTPPGLEATMARAQELSRTAKAFRDDAASFSAEFVPPKSYTAPVGALAEPQAVPLSALRNPPEAQPAPKPADTAEAIAARIIASDGPATPKSGDPEVEAIAARISASDALMDDEDDIESAARRILEA
ncbi:hypothetical protein [Croceicoccus naphthovorans]|uniref:Uncharacterized protein n=1 Tax=Croceicoccus naphthovorans TaxID=1348774 RepID=A0A0G3XHG2_9SPHN|nr:hypothetical protein [Croceicoccus naphthovorans]AKM10036.1 hypothetical protein AB433_08695 [Croceicoccus naphthovorans]MBB3991074.1 hypothetical protein [Croceicoccus naphthovorans]